MFQPVHRHGGRSRRPLPRRRGQHGIRRHVADLVSFALILAAIALLVLGRMDNQLLAQWRVKLYDLTTPLFTAASVPAGYVQRSLDRLGGFHATFGEVARLREENQRLRGIKWGIEALEQRNSELQALLNAVDEPGRRFITGRIVSGSPSLFDNSAVVNLGRRHGIDNGHAVINADGFVGRTSSTGDDSSRVLLLTDRLSRIPVVIGKQAVNAVAVGDGSPNPRVEFLRQDAVLYEGDLVFTSGEGGALPRGLPVGTIRLIDGRFTIATRARLQGVEFVSVLFAERRELASGR